jgi:hypothetical protein
MPVDDIHAFVYAKTLNHKTAVLQPLERIKQTAAIDNYHSRRSNPKLRGAEHSMGGRGAIQKISNEIVDPPSTTPNPNRG